MNAYSVSKISDARLASRESVRPSVVASLSIRMAIAKARRWMLHISLAIVAKFLNSESVRSSDAAIREYAISISGGGTVTLPLSYRYTVTLREPPNSFPISNWLSFSFSRRSLAAAANILLDVPLFT